MRIMWNKMKAITLSLVLCSFFAEANGEKILEDVSIRSIEKEDIRGSISFYQPLRRRGDAISNDIFHTVSIDIEPFHLTIASIINDESDEVKDNISSTLDQMKYDPELIDVSLGDITITFSDDTNVRLLNKRGRYLTQETQIDVEGGEATLLVDSSPYHIPTSSRTKFNSDLREFLEENLKFDGLSVKVGSGSIYSPSMQPSENGDGDKQHNPAREFGSQANDRPSVEVKSSADKMPVVVGSVLAAVLSVGVATALYMKKRGRNEMSPSSPRRMKRDLDFEQFVVECCTDNDMVFEDDVHYFTTVPKNDII